jgi:hypothetical protein
MGTPRSEDVQYMARDCIKALERASTEDQECGHIAADDALCELLENLGFCDVVEAYRKIPKWFA